MFRESMDILWLTDSRLLLVLLWLKLVIKDYHLPVSLWKPYHMEHTIGPELDQTVRRSIAQIDHLGYLDCNPDPGYTQRACENGQIMERILNYCDCFPSYDKQFEHYMEKRNLSARACNFFEHVRQGFSANYLSYYKMSMFARKSFKIN